MFAQLGDIEFEGVNGFSDLSKSVETLVAEHSLIDRKPKIQTMGSGLINVTIGIHLSVGFCNPGQRIEELEAIRSKYQIISYIEGNGKYVGDFIITGIGQTIQKTDADGNITEADITVSLLEVASDRDEQEVLIAKKNALAIEKEIFSQL
jgi:phage protein U